jgi:U3 small nucleolar RNA-associated protein 3
MILYPFIDLAEKTQQKDSFTIHFIKTKYNLLLHYCVHVSFYLMLKSKRQLISTHPLIKILVQYRQLLSQFEEHEENFFNKIKIIIKSNKNKLNLYNFIDYSKIDATNNSKSQSKQNIENKKLKQTITENQDNKISTIVTKRAITYQIAKNKGLTPLRKKEQRNPRVKHRNKYRKAKIHRKGAVCLNIFNTYTYIYIYIYIFFLLILKICLFLDS